MNQTIGRETEDFFSLQSLGALLQEAKDQQKPLLISLVQDTASPIFHMMTSLNLLSWKKMNPSNTNPLTLAEIVSTNTFIAFPESRKRVFYHLSDNLHSEVTQRVFEAISSENTLPDSFFTLSQKMKDSHPKVSLRFLELSAKRGDNQAIKTLASHYLSKKGGEQKAASILEKGALQGDMEMLEQRAFLDLSLGYPLRLCPWLAAASSLGSIEATKKALSMAEQEGLKNEQIRLLTRLCQFGETDSLYPLAIAYYSENLLPQAFFYMEKASFAKDSIASYTLYKWYRQRNDGERAYLFLEKAAEQRCPKAVYLLLKQSLLFSDLRRSKELLELFDDLPLQHFYAALIAARERKYEPAYRLNRSKEKLRVELLRLVLSLEQKNGVSCSQELLYLKKRASEGDPRACLLCGLCLQSLPYLKKAKELGHPLASYEIAYYHYKRGEQREAFLYFRKACRAGLPKAFFALGVMVLSQEKPNFEQAIPYFEQGSILHDKASKSALLHLYQEVKTKRLSSGFFFLSFFGFFKENSQPNQNFSIDLLQKNITSHSLMETIY